MNINKLFPKFNNLILASEAKKIKNSRGFKTTRLHLSQEDKTFNIAVKMLTPQEQKWVNSKGHAGWFKKFFWKPMKLNIDGKETTILVNINSAVKRLSLLGIFTPKEIKNMLNAGTLFEELEKNILKKNLSQMMNQTSDEKIEKIVAFIQTKKGEWEKETKETHQSIKIKASLHPELHRSLQYNSDGTIYMLFNKIDKGDTRLGKGSFKEVTRAMNLMTGEMVARIIQKNTPEAVSELDLSIQLSGQEGIAHTFAITQWKGNGKLGFMQKLYNGGDLSALVEDKKIKNNKKLYSSPTREEKLIVAQSLLKGLDWLHNKKKMVHRDIKPANLFLERDSKGKIINAVIADFGLAVGELDKKREEVEGTPVYYSPELCSAMHSNDKEIIANANQSSFDNWAAGIILYQLFKDEIPEWNHLPNPPDWFKKSVNVYKAILMIKKLSDKGVHWLPEPQSSAIGSIIYGLLQPNPKLRMDTGKALEILKTLAQPINSPA